MSTKKALWSVLSYPDSSDLNNVLQTLSGAGAQYCYCLHDGDFRKDGKPDKPHIHILCGWASGAPTWAKFVDLLKSCGAVCPGKRGQYDPASAEVHDPDRAEEYIEHRDPGSVKAGKHDYTGKAVYSNGWCLSDYVTYSQKRKQAKQVRADDKAERAADCIQLFDLISTHGITEYCVLVDMLRSTNSDLLASLLNNAYPVKSYLDSLRGYNCSVDSSITKELKKKCRALEVENARLKAEIADLNDTIRDTKFRTIEQYSMIFGESGINWYEI